MGVVYYLTKYASSWLLPHWWVAAYCCLEGQGIGLDDWLKGRSSHPPFIVTAPLYASHMYFDTNKKQLFSRNLEFSDDDGNICRNPLIVTCRFYHQSWICLPGVPMKITHDSLNRLSPFVVDFPLKSKLENLDLWQPVGIIMRNFEPLFLYVANLRRSATTSSLCCLVDVFIFNV